MARSSGRGRKRPCWQFLSTHPAQGAVLLALPQDEDPKLAEYAHPERLVTTNWLAKNLGAPGLVVVESDEDVLLYDGGHIPGAIKVDWQTELNDQVTRDFLDGERFAALLSAKGISRNNWWAAYTLWVFSLFAHPDVRLLDGAGRLGRRSPSAAPCPATQVTAPIKAKTSVPVRSWRTDPAAWAFWSRRCPASCRAWQEDHRADSRSSSVWAMSPGSPR